MGALDEFRFKRWQRYGPSFRQRSEDKALFRCKMERMNRYRAEHLYCHNNLHRRQRDKKWPNPYWQESRA